MEHTGSQVRLAAHGPNAKGFADHHHMTDVFGLIQQSFTA
jgi:alkaline phosphatase